MPSAKVSKIYGRNTYICEVVKKKGNVCVYFPHIFQTAKAMTIMHEKCLILMEWHEKYICICVQK